MTPLMVDSITELMTALTGQKSKVLIPELLFLHLIIKHTWVMWGFFVYHFSICLLYKLFAYVYILIKQFCKVDAISILQMRILTL